MSVCKVFILINQIFLISFFDFVSQVFGWEQWTLPIPDQSFSFPGSQGIAPSNIVFRFALAILVYLGVYLLQVSLS